jgi:putative hydrolase of the HAD superfamily
LEKDKSFKPNPFFYYIGKIYKKFLEEIVMIKNIIFDMGGVLVEYNPENIIRNFTNDKYEIEQLKRAIFLSDEWRKLDEGLINTEEAVIKMSESLSDELKSKCSNIMKNWYKCLPFYDKTCDLVRELNQNGYHLYILSNTHIQFFNYVKSTEIYKYFEGEVISAEENLLKPDKRIYLKLLKKYSLNPEECFFIDDSDKNITTAKSCGIKGHIFNIEYFNDLVKAMIQIGINIE